MDDFVEDYIEDGRYLFPEDIDEIGRIMEDGRLLLESYLFNNILPYCLPFFDKEGNPRKFYKDRGDI